MAYKPNKQTQKLKDLIDNEFQVKGYIRWPFVQSYLNDLEEETKREMTIVLGDVLRYINHYQEQLNIYDGGERKGFKSVEELLTKLKNDEKNRHPAASN